jgi:hypothetical protein
MQKKMKKKKIVRICESKSSDKVHLNFAIDYYYYVLVLIVYMASFAFIQFEERKKWKDRYENLNSVLRRQQQKKLISNHYRACPTINHSYCKKKKLKLINKLKNRKK